MQATPVARILSLRSDGLGPIENANYLADYDAIILEPTFRSLFRRDRLDETSELSFNSETSAADIDRLSAEVARRAEELRAFFRIGGLMIVTLVMPRVHDQTEENFQGGLTRHRIDPHSWFLSTIAQQLRREDAVDGFVLEGRGSPIRVVEPGHPFGKYLELRNGYQARITDVIRRYPNAVVLAENRGGDPVAAEFRIGSGSLILLPPPRGADDETELGLAVGDALALSIRPREWIVREERELAQGLDERLAEMRNARESAGQRLREVRAAKNQVLQESTVRRAIGYWERATRSGTRMDTAFHELYRLVEMLEDHYSGGERELSDALGVPLAKIKALK